MHDDDTRFDDDSDDRSQPMVELVSPPIEPPAPGFWGAVLWCFVMLSVLYGAMIATAVAVWIVEAAASGDPQGFMKKEQDMLQASADAGKNELPPGLGAAITWGMLVGQLAGLAFVLGLIRIRVGRGWTKRLAVRRPSGVHLLLAILVTPGLMILHGGFHELAHAAFGVKADDAMGPMLKSMFAGWPSFFAVLVIGVCPGVLEELFCRGYLGRGLVARYGFVGGIALTSMFFGMLHVMPLYAIGTMFMGVTLHLAYVASRSLWVPILIHTLNNSLTILATLGVIQVDAAQQEAATLDLWIYVASASSVILLYIAMWTGRVRWQSEVPPPYQTLETPPTGTPGELQTGRPNPIATILGLACTATLMYLIFA